MIHSAFKGIVIAFTGHFDTHAAHQRRIDVHIQRHMLAGCAFKRRAQTEIDLERRRAFDEVKGELSGIALDIASQVIEREVNEKDHEAFINEFIKNVGEAS